MEETKPKSPVEASRHPEPGVPIRGGATENAHLFRVTLYSIGDAVIATDAAARITFMNPVAETLTGWAADEAVGMTLDTVFQIVNQDTHRTVESPVAKALREGIVVGLANHTLLITRDGTERPIIDSAAPIRDASGAVAGVVLVFRDISERHRYEQSIREALAYATDILATLREPFLVLDKDLRVVSANRRFLETFQVSMDETEGGLVYELGNGQWDIHALRAALGQITSSDVPVVDFEIEHAFPHLGTRHMRLNARRVRNPGNDSELLLLAIEDVTDQKRSQRHLILSEQRYRRLFEAARDGILILDAKTMRIEDANPFMCELLGYTLEQFLGKELWEIGLFQDKRESLVAIETLQNTGYVRYRDLPLESGTGQIKEVEFICNIYDEDHHSVAQCNIRDITVQKTLERQIQQQAEALADTNRRKDEFLAMLSHELRNPIAPMVNALHLMGQDENGNELRRDAQAVIGRQLKHLSRLVDDLLEVSRVTTGRVRLHRERVDLKGIVTRALERTQPPIQRRLQNVAVSLPHDSVWIIGDAARLEQVVGNLVDNASKYSDEGLEIRLAVEAQDGHTTIRVTDDGIGIEQALLPHIFDLFTQADRSLARTDSGLGIGLAVVKSLVELHSGTVEAHSDGIGRGSEFLVRLPVATTRGTEPELHPSSTTVSTANALRILVVEDSVDAAQMSALLLRSWGHDVRVAHNGSEALERAAGFDPHVILLDIGLPDMDGYEIARRVRQSTHHDGVRLLVAITGYGQDADRQRAKETGFDLHLVKPVEPSILMRHLEGVQLPRL